MIQIINAIRMDEFVPIVAVIGLLVMTGGLMARPDSVVYRQARRIAGGTIVVYAVMGLYAWAPSTAGECLVILVRTLLAAGVVFGLSLVVLAVVHQVVGNPVAAMVARYRAWTIEIQRWTAEKQARREAAKRERRERAENERRARLLELELKRTSEIAARAEQERRALVNEARAEVIQFYDEHADSLADALPPALFRSQLQTRIPENVTAEQAWQATQDMIAAMLPTIAAGRERQRAEEEAQRKIDEQAAEEERKRRQPEEQRDAIHRLTEWYVREKAAIEERLPDDGERMTVLGELADRYDRLMKESLRELKP